MFVSIDDINKKDDNGKTILHLAIQYKYLDLVNIILKNSRCNPNVIDKDLLTPLHYAVIYNYSEVVKKLLAIPKINTNPRDKYLLTPFWYALKHHRYKIIELLLTYSPYIHMDYNYDGMSFDPDCTECLIHRLKIKKTSDIINHYALNPNKTKLYLLQQNGYLRENIVYLYIMVVLNNDGYFKVKEQSWTEKFMINKQRDSQRKFFNFIGKFPIELQMRIINLVYSSVKIFIFDIEFNRLFPWFVKYYL